MNYYVIALIVLAILVFIKFLVALCIYMSRQEERIQRRPRRPNQLTRVYIVPQQQIQAHQLYRPPPYQMYQYNVPPNPVVNQNLAYVKDEPPSYHEAVQQNLRLQ